MKMDAKSIKNAGIQALSVTGGFTASHVASRFIPDQFQKYSGPILIGAGLLGAAFVKNDTVKSACAGVAGYGLISTANTFLGPQEGEAPTGIKAIVGNYLPSLNGTAATGMGYVPYNENSIPMLGMGTAIGNEFEDAYAPATDITAMM